MIHESCKRVVVEMLRGLAGQKNALDHTLEVLVLIGAADAVEAMPARPGVTAASCACLFDADDNQVEWCIPHAELRQRLEKADELLLEARERLYLVEGCYRLAKGGKLYAPYSIITPELIERIDAFRNHEERS